MGAGERGWELPRESAYPDRQAIAPPQDPTTEVLTRHVPWLLAIPKSRPGLGYRAAKRLCDVALILLALPVLLPVLLGCAIALKVESWSAPVLFRQLRTGRGGQRFRMFKFRTMVANADELKACLAHLNQLQWPDFKVDNDPRVTRVGRLLRRWSLDELPQLLNVIRGEMTLIGPRPTSFGPETYQDWHKARLAVQPGLTGLWQIAGRGAIEFDDRVRLDVAYIERQSLRLDLKILCHTVGAVLADKGTT